MTWICVGADMSIYVKTEIKVMLNYVSKDITIFYLELLGNFTFVRTEYNIKFGGQL